MGFDKGLWSLLGLLLDRCPIDSMPYAPVRYDLSN